jgi:transcriptional regulator with XRE-family HTH domain
MERQGVDQAIARRVRERREQLGWSLERLAGLSGVSRAMISRIERAENSATAALLSKLCFGLGITLSSLMADAERPPHSVVRRTQQRSWRDPETGYGRRMVSPAQTGSAVEIAEVDLPAGTRVSYEAPPFLAYDQHILVLAGRLTLTFGNEKLHLSAGDCVHMTLESGATFENRTAREVRYLVVLKTEPRPGAALLGREERQTRDVR